jgi:hypothetical protein
MDRPIPPVPLDPQEFLEVLEYAMAVSGCQIPDELQLPPPDSKPFEFEHEGEKFNVDHAPLDRFGLAAARRFRGREPEMFSFMFRWMAMIHATKAGVPPGLWAEEGTTRQSIIHAAATCSMYLEQPAESWEFNPEDLYALAEKLEGQ